MRQKLKINTKKIVNALSLMLVSFGLIACASQPPRPAEPVFVAPTEKPDLREIREGYIKQLSDNHVQVIHVGETLRIVLRDDNLFIPGSANVLADGMKILRTVTFLMNTYDIVEVKVAGYLDNQLDSDVAKALSTRQAQVVLNKLRYYSIDTRFLYATGYGSANPVAWNGDASGRSLNRRVEISFQYYPKTRGYN